MTYPSYFGHLAVFGRRYTAVLATLLLIAQGLPVLAQDAVQSQDELTKRVTQNDPGKTSYIKDRPILGWSIDSADPADIPKAIWDRLGEADQTEYTAEYLAKNTGSIVALQMSSDGPDFYIIGKDVFDEKYEVVGIQNVVEKNAKLVSRLETIPDVNAFLTEKNASLVGALKTVPVEMIELSDIGYDLTDAVTIQAPWGEQTKPEGTEGFLVWDTSENQYYMVNQGDDGNPLGYIRAGN